MKRCPQCDFIYEDDQSLCDMDGGLLVFDSRTLPNLHALATVEVPLPAKAHSRHRAFSAMAALILATVLSLGYFVSTQQTTPVIAPVSGSMQTPLKDTSLTTPPPAEPANTTTDATQPPTSPGPEVNAATAVTAKADKKSASPKTTAPQAKKVNAKAPTTQPEPEEPKKEDSKVGSILKKTGRLLKKPFKL